MHLPEKSLTIPESAVIYTLHGPNKKYTIVPTIIQNYQPVMAICIRLQILLNVIF